MVESSTDKKTFLEALKRERTEWERQLGRVDEGEIELPGVAGEWSVKDVIAHVTWHEQEMLGVLKAKALVASDWWNLPLDERNAAIYALNRSRPVQDVLREAAQVYAQLLQHFEGLEDADLVDPRRYADMPEDWIPWQIFAENTYEHYHDHTQDLREWLSRRYP